MRRRSCSLIFIILSGVLMTQARVVFAMPAVIDHAVREDFTPAILNRGLETAYVQPDPSKFRDFVVLERGGVPAQQARFFVTWSDYDYRGVVIHLSDGDRISTRRGRPYTYLQRGDVMAVAGIKYFNTTIYLKLISPEVYVPENKRHDKRHSRVTVMLGFKFPKGVIKKDDADAVIAKMIEWLKPFPNITAAQAYASGMRDEKTYLSQEAADEASKEKSGAGETEAASAAAVGTVAKGSESEKMKNLEDKIDRARRDLDEAEKDLKELKKGK